MSTKQPYNGCHLVTENCPSGESLCCKQRGVQPFPCTPATRFVVAYNIVQYATDNSTRAGSALGAFTGEGSRKELESNV